MKRLHVRVGLGLVLLVLLLLPGESPLVAAQPALDETWIAFTSLAPGEEGIWMVHPDGSGLSRLTEGRDLYPTWSPDGNLLAYVHEVSGTLLYGEVNGYRSEIRIVDTAGRIRFTVGQSEWVGGEAATPLTGNVGPPQWSSDGQAISYGVNLEYFFLVTWGGRRTFYLFSPRIEVGYGPQGSLLAEGSIMLDQSWAPGPVPTWVRSTADLATCQVMAYDQTVLNTTNELYFNPRWSPGGESLTVYRQTLEQDSFSNALLQVNTAGEVERTLWESDSLFLYTIAEPSPDGQRHLIGVSADAPAWFLQALAGMFQEPAPPEILPLDPSPTGYLYVVDQGDALSVVAQPQRGTVDLVSRQPWSPNGAQLVFMRAPHPAAEGTVGSGLGIYVGPPGQTRLLVPFSAAQITFELTLAYPVWQPAPQGPLPTMVPLGPLGPEPTVAPTAEPTMPPPTETPPPASPTAEASPAPTSTPTPAATTAPAPAAPAAPQSNLRTYILIAIGLVVVVLVALIIWMLIRPERPGGGARTLQMPAFLTRLFRSRRAGGRPTPRNPFRPFSRRSKPAAKEGPQPSGGLLRRPPSKADEEKPKKRFSLFSRRGKTKPSAPSESAAELPPAPREAAGDEDAPEAVFPSLRTSREAPAEWPEVDERLTSTEPEAPAPVTEAPTEWPATEERPAPTAEAPAERPAAEEWPPGPTVPAEPSVEEPISRPEPHPAPPPSTTAEVIPAVQDESLPDEQALLRQGVAQVKAGQLAAGMLTLHKAIRRAPKMGAAWLWLGWAAALQDQRVLAERCFGRAQELGMGEEAEQALAWLHNK